MLITAGFGAASLAVVAVTTWSWRTRRDGPVPAALAVMLFAMWAVSNLIMVTIGGPGTWLFPIMDVLGGLVVVDLWRHRPESHWRLWLAFSFMLQLALHVAYHARIASGYVDLAAAFHAYAVGLNVLFAVQLLFVGTSGVRHVVSAGLARLRDLASRQPA